MKSEMSSESPQSGSHAHAFDELDESALAYVRAAFIEEGVQSGLSRVSAENLIDFMWAARGWPLVCEEQWRNIRRWSLN